MRRGSAQRYGRTSAPSVRQAMWRNRKNASSSAIAEDSRQGSGLKDVFASDASCHHNAVASAMYI